jgi:iron(III) transport system substrate-binding protein
VTRFIALAISLFVFEATGCLWGCGKSAGAGSAPDGKDKTVLVYCSVDEPFARAVFEEFERRTGLSVEALQDTEAGKTTGLVNRIRSEQSRPRADVFWSSEIFNTILLAREGLFEKYIPDSATDIPGQYKDPNGYWTAIGLRGRVLVFDSARTPREQVPRQWADIADERWRGRLAMGNPQFGTTRGHVSLWFAIWGAEPAGEFLRTLSHHDLIIVDGNSSVVRQVIAGRAALGLTDTDDVWVAQRNYPTLDLVYPDHGDDGTLWIPNTVALVRGGPHPDAARRLIEFLVSADVEEMLARSDSRNVPVRAALRDRLGFDEPRPSAVSYEQVADAMESAISEARKVLLR